MNPDGWHIRYLVERNAATPKRLPRPPHDIDLAVVARFNAIQYAHLANYVKRLGGDQ